MVLQLKSYDDIDAAFGKVQDAIDAGELADQFPDNGLRSCPFLCFDDGAGIVVTGCGAVVHAGVAEGHRQRDTALHGRWQVIPSGAGALPVAAAVVRMNARLDAVRSISSRLSSRQGSAGEI